MHPEVVHPEDDGLLGSVLTGLLEDSHRAGPHDVPALLWTAGRRLGLTHTWIYLADVQQEQLVALPEPPLHEPPIGPPRAGSPPAGPRPPPLPADTAVLDIDGSLAGHAYRTETVQVSGLPDGPGNGTGTEQVGWIPLVDGIGRIGVLRIAAPLLDDARIARCRVLASAAALVVAVKAPFSDVLIRTMRRRAMSLQAELLWAFLPPRTIGTDRVTSSAVLEPAYEVGGDAFDHNLTGSRLHVTLVDAMGHDLASGGCSAVAVAACRSTRRDGGGLPDIADAIDAALGEWIPDRLLTCVIANLDTVTGELSWINCGHPPPLLIRQRRVVAGALERQAHLPLGLPLGVHRTRPLVHTAQLEPGDRVLLHSDGVTEARDREGRLFGDRQLVDTVVRAMADGLPAPEALRRLMRKILTHQGNRLRDDATILLVDWHPAPDA
ncbi:PP2C family protein-serine/threonine phosphatase [Kitasatospora sp. NPDC054939]